MQRLLKTAITVFTAVIFFVPHYTNALSLEPLTQVFDTSVDGRIRTFRVTNTQDQRISVRIRITTREVEPDGTEVRSSADEEWLVFPRQVTLEPGTAQAVRVQYTGSGGVQTERAYRIIAEQLPVDFSGGNRQSGINVLFRYEGSMYVRPEQAVPELVLVETSRQFENDDFLGVRIEFENRGTAHVILDDMTIQLTLSDTTGEVLATETLTEEQLPVIGGANILAGATLVENVQLPEEWSQGVLDVAYDVELVQ